MRALGVDWGTVRIGLATCDREGILASPFGTIEGVKDLPRVRRDIVRIVADEEVEIVVVGHPLSLDGSRGPAAQAVEEQARGLVAVLPVPVVLHDERLTTVEAHRLLAASGTGGRERRRVVDRAAAAVLLQAWLDGGAPTHLTPDSLPPVDPPPSED